MKVFPLLAYGHGESIVDMVVRAVVHSVVWQAVERVMRPLGPMGGIVAAVVVIGVLMGLRRLRIV